MQKDETLESDAIKWILHCAVEDVNWRGALKRLTTDELFYCLQRETRATGLKKIEG
ncbi:MAG: hypothetical protein ABSD68_02835 [Candidatus Micrarchaeales archaeon]|jgi:hypothetical protein